MRHIRWLPLLCCLLFSCANSREDVCYIGAFLADVPLKSDIDDFRSAFGKNPGIINVFLPWGKFVDEMVIRDVYSSGSVLMVTWEPWYPESTNGLDYRSIVSGGYDDYIKEFAVKLKLIEGPVYLRFAHEMNGNWYPWSLDKIGADTYRSMFRHVHGLFRASGAGNVKWVFCVNCENVPRENDYRAAWPGGGFVDYIGIDGYNWGKSRPWSRWMSFEEIFMPVYKRSRDLFRKPVMITEVASTSRGGERKAWVRGAFGALKKMPGVKAVILFNVDKEEPWKIRRGTPDGLELSGQLKDKLFSVNGA